MWFEELNASLKRKFDEEDARGIDTADSVWDDLNLGEDFDLTLTSLEDDESSQRLSPFGSEVFLDGELAAHDSADDSAYYQLPQFLKFRSAGN